MILSIYIQLFILISRFQQSSSSFFLSKYNEVERKSARKKKTTYLRADNTKLSHMNNEIQYEQNFQEKEIYYGKSIGTRWMRDLAEEVDEEEGGENENNEISYDEGNSTKYDGIKEEVEENIYDDDNSEMEKESIENEIEKEQQQQQQQRQQRQNENMEVEENVYEDENNEMEKERIENEMRAEQQKQQQQQQQQQKEKMDKKKEEMVNEKEKERKENINDKMKEMIENEIEKEIELNESTKATTLSPSQVITLTPTTSPVTHTPSSSNPTNNPTTRDPTSLPTLSSSSQPTTYPTTTPSSSPTTSASPTSRADNKNNRNDGRNNKGQQQQQKQQQQTTVLQPSNEPSLMISKSPTALPSSQQPSEHPTMSVMSYNSYETIHVRLAIALVPGRQRHITATGIMNGEEPELSKAIIKTTTQILCEDTDFIIMTGYVNEGGSIHDICRNFNHPSSISSFDDAYDASQMRTISDKQMAEIIRNTEVNQSTLLMDLRNVITNVMEHDEIVDGINNENGSSTSNDDTNVSFFLFTLTFRVLNVGWDEIHATIIPPATATTTKLGSQSTKIMMSAKSTTTATAEYSPIEKIQHISQMIISNRIKNGSFFKIIISEDNNNADIIAVAAMERQDDGSYIFHIDTTAANYNGDGEQSSSRQSRTSGKFDDDMLTSIITLRYTGYLLLVCWFSMILTLYINRRHRARKHKRQQQQQQEKEKEEEANDNMLLSHLTTNNDNHYNKSKYDDIDIDEDISPHIQFNTMDGTTNYVTTTRATTTTARRTKNNNDNVVPNSSSREDDDDDSAMLSERGISQILELSRNSLVSVDSDSNISEVSSGIQTAAEQSIGTLSIHNIFSMYRDLVG